MEDGFPELLPACANSARRSHGDLAVVLLTLLQTGAGIVNVLLLAPVWMQIAHLFIADSPGGSRLHKSGPRLTWLRGRSAGGCEKPARTNGDPKRFWAVISCSRVS